MYTDLSTGAPLSSQAARLTGVAINTLRQIEDQRREWINCSLDDQIMVYMLLGQSNSHLVHSAASTVSYALFVALSWNYTDTSPDVRAMRRAIDTARTAVLNKGSLIDAALLVQFSRALDIAREKIFRKCPPATLTQGMREMQRALHAL